MQFRSSGITDVGLVRGHNEDNYLINDELHLFVVADGMGGHAGGERASASAVMTVEEAFCAVQVLDGSADPTDRRARTTERLERSIVRAGQRIHDEALENTELHGMGTTLVALVLGEGCAIIGHVGDSRVYRCRGDEVVQLTEDHSLIAERVRLGLMTEDEAKTHRMRNVITRSLGYQEEVEVDLLQEEIEVGDRFLLCTDGLSGYVEGDEMGCILLERGLQGGLRQLVDLACERGGEDNITAVIVEIDALD